MSKRKWPGEDALTYITCGCGGEAGRPTPRGPGKSVRKVPFSPQMNRGHCLVPMSAAGREAREDGRTGSHTRDFGPPLKGGEKGWLRGMECEAEGGIPQKLRPRGSQRPSAISGNSAGIGLSTKQRPICPLHSKWKCRCSSPYRPALSDATEI